MPHAAAWFRRLGDIPGIEWSSPGVDRSRLPHHDARPELHTYEFDGHRHQSLWWASPEGGTSASPAKVWAQVDAEQSPDQALYRLYEVLELPGEPVDYHFAIQAAANDLWRHRREDPSLLIHVEELSWLDIRLIEAYPSAIAYENQAGQGYFAVAAFHTLVSLYEREGYLEDAVTVLKRSERFGYDIVADCERLEAKRAAIAAEASG